MQKKWFMTAAAATLLMLGLGATNVPTAIAQAIDNIDGTYRVNARSAHRFTCRFVGGETAMVSVSGDGDTDLDLFVYDASGNLVDFDDDNTDECLAVWTPRRTGTYTIRVVNLGSIYNRYNLRTN